MILNHLHLMTFILGLALFPLNFVHAELSHKEQISQDSVKTSAGAFAQEIVHDFSLLNVDSTHVSLQNFENAKGFLVVFTCNHCPFAKLYTQRLNDLNTKYKAAGVPLLAINSMDALVYEEESFELMRERATNENYNFPYLQDESQSVGKDFGAKHTPQAFVIWKENDAWVVKYKGAIDNNGEHPELATSYIGNAVEELLQAKPVSKPHVPSFGCQIYYRK